MSLPTTPHARATTTTTTTHHPPTGQAAHLGANRKPRPLLACAEWVGSWRRRCCCCCEVRGARCTLPATYVLLRAARCVALLFAVALPAPHPTRAPPSQGSECVDVVGGRPLWSDLTSIHQVWFLQARSLVPPLPPLTVPAASSRMRNLASCCTPRLVGDNDAVHFKSLAPSAVARPFAQLATGPPRRRHLLCSALSSAMPRRKRKAAAFNTISCLQPSPQPPEPPCLAC
jgi:hypothetical protein